jgi:hypothetical protein
VLSARRAPVLAVASVALAFALAACGNSTPAATPATTTLLAATQQPTLVSAPSATALTTPTPAPTAAPTIVPSIPASAELSMAPVATVVPGSSLDPSLSDAGIVGRLTIPNDTRNAFSGTHQIIGLAADSSNCGYSLDGNEFTAVAWYDAAPDGMLHQMSVAISTDFVPSNDGEERAAISDGSVYADFVTDSGFGTAYGGATSKGDGSSSSIDAKLTGDTLVFTFTGTTWDGIDFSGQMMCTGMGGK